VAGRIWAAWSCLRVNPVQSSPLLPGETDSVVPPARA
jgi:hypothetical protein